MNWLYINGRGMNLIVSRQILRRISRMVKIPTMEGPRSTTAWTFSPSMVTVKRWAWLQAPIPQREGRGVPYKSIWTSIMPQSGEPYEAHYLQSTWNDYFIMGPAIISSRPKWHVCEFTMRTSLDVGLDPYHFEAWICIDLLHLIMWIHVCIDSSRVIRFIVQ